MSDATDKAYRLGWDHSELEVPSGTYPVDKLRDLAGITATGVADDDLLDAYRRGRSDERASRKTP